MNPKMLTSEASNFLEISLPGLHKQLKSKQLQYFKSQNKLYFGHDTAKQIFKLNFKPTCWSWQNLKGGVGKTHLSYATATRLSLYGAKVAVIDLDQQGNFTQACNVNPENTPVLIDIIKNNLNILDCMIEVVDGLDILPSRIDNAVLDNLFAINGLPVEKELKKRVMPLKDKYDFIFIDCPPSLGQTVMSASLAADYIIVPVDPERFSLSGLNITIDELTNRVSSVFDVNLNIKIILNKFDGRTGLSHSVLSTLMNEEPYKRILFKSFIRTSQELPNSVSKGKSIFDSLKSSTAKEDIDLLAREIIEMSVVNEMKNMLDKKNEEVIYNQEFIDES